MNEFERDLNLGVEISFSNTRVPPESLRKPQAVLLTGATGFIGAFLLEELLQKTSTKVYCLVRANSESDALARLHRSLEGYGLWQDAWLQRIVPLAGDLAEPRLGLSEQQFDHLAKTLDQIYHNGAVVNFVQPYAQLRLPNVFGTLEVLKLAGQGRVKPVHYISTLGVFSRTAHQGEPPVDETVTPRHGEMLELGYAQSKWMAERLVMAARDQGLPVTIHRPEAVSGHSQTGACKTSDVFWKLIKVCLSLGKIPQERIEGTLEFLPIDYLSQGIIYLSTRADRLGRSFNYLNPNAMPMTRFVPWLTSYGYCLQIVPYDQWRADLLNIATHSPNSQEASLAPLFWNTHMGNKENPEFLQFDHEATRAALAEGGIICPTIDYRLLKVYFDYFVHTGFFTAPAL